LSAQGDRYVHLNNEVDEHRHQITALDNRSRSDAEALRAECRRIDGRYDKAAKAFSELGANVRADLAAFRHALAKLAEIDWRSAPDDDGDNDSDPTSAPTWLIQLLGFDPFQEEAEGEARADRPLVRGLDEPQ
jgi:hypothetical protein